MTRRLGLYLARVMGTNVLPNEPVPPVIRIEELVSMLVPASHLTILRTEV